MKIKILIPALLLFSGSVLGQIVKKDTIPVDSTQKEIIEKMPMDTTHIPDPLEPDFQPDSVAVPKTYDDKDPKRKKRQ
jgi:hypothetical protein